MRTKQLTLSITQTQLDSTNRLRTRCRPLFNTLPYCWASLYLSIILRRFQIVLFARLVSSENMFYLDALWMRIDYLRTHLRVQQPNAHCLDNVFRSHCVVTDIKMHRDTRNQYNRLLKWIESGRPCHMQRAGLFGKWCIDSAGGRSTNTQTHSSWCSRWIVHTLFKCSAVGLDDQERYALYRRLDDGFTFARWDHLKISANKLYGEITERYMR